MTDEPEAPSHPFWESETLRHLVSGGVAGAVSRTVVSPLERMKILFQVQATGIPQYSGVVSTLGKIYRQEGLIGYFRGNGMNVLRIVPYSAVQFATYEWAKKWIQAQQCHGVERDLDTAERLLAGGLAGATSVSVTYPIDLVRTRLSMHQAGYVDPRIPHATAWEIAKGVWRYEHQWRGLYRGLIPTVLGIAPYVAINFSAYEKPQAVWVSPERTVLLRLGCGALAATVAQTVTYPLEFLRRRMQVTGMPGCEYKYDGAWHAIRTVVRDETWRGLYKGMLPNYLKVVPATAVSFLTYEFCKGLLGIHEYS
ncbi:hypothetical protein CXG81DRAFT_13190 [Caulochytrium protostelioides]|uniref:Mitochondrial carrier n=1 Tax=Caulochytrium protostelioides TaxID=1555241 RepID=A0A4V1IUG3_9FUNG|nr:hypothetical protein CXG81DRAFT_13190 [Caulochytrium protostelioides]|eukprot:RKP00459.1 hypothetical protein CXG81DRAFT_13190 [Caulochytrium protostelioides]